LQVATLKSLNSFEQLKIWQQRANIRLIASNEALQSLHPHPCINPLTSTVAQGWAPECPDVKNYKWRLNPVWHKNAL